jgi:ArsR family transcriptional regulator
MKENASKQSLSTLLETHFCDAGNQEKHRSELKKLSNEYLSPFNLDQKAKLFKALGDETRLNILKLLTLREMCVCELTAALDLTQPNLTHHAKKLEHAGLVDHEKRGKWVYYSIKDVEILNSLGAI